MTCKDCIYYEKCSYHIDEETDMTINECTDFKDKSKFVEVVRCKDCTFYYKGVCNYDEADSDLYGYTHFVDEDYFCGDGERKDEQLQNQNTI